MMPTKERLAQRLHAIGLFDLERRARNGEFSDFESDIPFPKKILVETLYVIINSGTSSNPGMLREVAEEVITGKWDDTKEESDAWFEREGKGLIDE